MNMRVAVLLLVFLTCLPGCGRKPAGLVASPDAAADAYPQVYPKPLPNEQAPKAPDSDLTSKYRARPEQALQ